MKENLPEKIRLNSQYLSDYDNSMFLKEESLFIVATPAEIHLFDAVSLERLQVYIPKNINNKDIISMMRENIPGLKNIIYILYHGFELLELKLVKVEHFNIDSGDLVPKYLLKFKRLSQIAYVKKSDVWDSIGATLFAYRNSVTGFQSLLSCYLPISYPLSKAE